MPVGNIDPSIDEQLEALARQAAMHPDGTPISWELVISLNTPAPDARAALDSSLAKFSTAVEHSVPVRVVDSSDVRSASHARNTGAAAAAADLLAFCDSDDIADPAWLSALLQALGTADAVGGFLEEERLAVPGQENWRPPATPGGNPHYLDHPYLVSANMGMTAKVFRDAGGFDTSLIRGEDIALSFAMLRNGVELGFAADAVMHYRHRKGLWPMLKQHYLYGRGMSQILARYGLPDDDGGSGTLLRANGQKVAQMNAVHVMRRGSIAVGRLVGLAEETVLPKITRRAASSAS